MFPYYYNAPDGKKNGCYVTIMSSEDDGRSFTTVCQRFTNSGSFKDGNIESFGSYISKIIELANGDILLNIRTSGLNGWTFWLLSKDCGKNWDITVTNSGEENNVNI